MEIKIIILRFHKVAIFTDANRDVKNIVSRNLFFKFGKTTHFLSAQNIQSLGKKIDLFLVDTPYKIKQDYLTRKSLKVLTLEV